MQHLRLFPFADKFRISVFVQDRCAGFIKIGFFSDVPVLGIGARVLYIAVSGFERFVFGIKIGFRSQALLLIGSADGADAAGIGDRTSVSIQVPFENHIVVLVQFPVDPCIPGRDRKGLFLRVHIGQCIDPLAVPIFLERIGIHLSGGQDQTVIRVGVAHGGDIVIARIIVRHMCIAVDRVHRCTLRIQVILIEHPAGGIVGHHDLVIAFGRKHRLAVQIVGGQHHAAIFVFIMDFGRPGLLHDIRLALLVKVPFRDVMAFAVVLILDGTVALLGRHRIPVDIGIDFRNRLVLGFSGGIAVADPVIAVNTVDRLLIHIQIVFRGNLFSVIGSHQHVIAQVLHDHAVVVFIKIVLLEDAAERRIVGFHAAVALAAQDPLTLCAEIAHFLLTVARSQHHGLPAVSVLVPERRSVRIVVPVGGRCRLRILIFHIGVSAGSGCIVHGFVIPRILDIPSPLQRPLKKGILDLCVEGQIALRIIVGRPDVLVAIEIDV